MTQHDSAKSSHHALGSDVPQESRSSSLNMTPGANDQVKQAAGQLAGQAQHTATQLTDQARQRVSAQLTDQKGRAAEGLSSVAQALRQSGGQLRDQNQQNITVYFDQAAAQVERLSNYLQRRDLGQLIDDGERFARRQPALFLGGAFVLGLLGARFLKSSRPEPTNGYAASASMADQRRGYASSYANADPHEPVAVHEYDAATPPGSYRTPPDRSMFGRPPAREGAPSDSQREE